MQNHAIQKQQWIIGDTRISRIEEQLGPMFDPKHFLPDYDLNVVARHSDWLYPNHIDPASGRLVASMHAWLIETPQHKILVDTCIGNHKERMPARHWHNLQTPWLERLAAHGVTPHDIDYVMCTHLHVDHVGWNTQLVDGQWVPTFPNAIYMFSKPEFDFWRAERDSIDSASFNQINRQTFDDSVLPIMHLAQLVEGEHEVITDLLHIVPAPGHTPGSITIDLHLQQGKSVIFTGDICHHPLQVYQPDWNSAYCELPQQARATRRRVLEQCVEHNTLMMPAHFGWPFAGYVQDSHEGFSFAFDTPL
jgi:glyoxylase-like metal-dependent hydrolase (beta-lactamase superfamily II)